MPISTASAPISIASAISPIMSPACVPTIPPPSILPVSYTHLRYALRATLAVAAGYAVSLHLPWAAHKYWILTTIVVVMRGNLAQTLQRRDARVAGTLLGCLLVMALLATHPGARTLFLVIALSMGLAHAFALRRYLFTTVFATLAGLLQAHLLMVGVAPTFAVFERLGDTVLGAALAWLFSYVLPAWERHQLPCLLYTSRCV